MCSEKLEMNNRYPPTKNRRSKNGDLSKGSAAMLSLLLLSFVFLFAETGLSEPSEPKAASLEGEESGLPSKLLRDPFWEVGYVPSDWGRKPGVAEKKIAAEEWDAPASQLKVSGVSRMGSRVMAVINGSLYSSGDVVEIVHFGKTFQWKVMKIKSNGSVKLERYKIITDTPK